MWKDDRTWHVEPRTDLEQLARDLTCKRFSLEQAFQTTGGTIWANVSPSCDRECPQEYAVLRPVAEGFHQVQTVVVTWCSAYQLIRYLRQADQRQFDTLFADFVLAADRLQFEPANLSQPGY
jgi:hypothetical protein